MHFPLDDGLEALVNDPLSPSSKTHFLSTGDFSSSIQTLALCLLVCIIIVSHWHQWANGVLCWGKVLCCNA